MHCIELVHGDGPSRYTKSAHRWRCRSRKVLADVLVLLWYHRFLGCSDSPATLCRAQHVSPIFFFFIPFVHLCDTAIMVCEYAARAVILGGFIITVSSCWHCLCISLELVCLAGFLTGQSCLQACSWGDGRKYLALKLSLGQTLHPCVSRGSRAIPPLLLGSYFTFE